MTKNALLETGPKNWGMGRPPPSPHSGNAWKKTFFSIDVFPKGGRPKKKCGKLMTFAITRRTAMSIIFRTFFWTASLSSLWGVAVILSSLIVIFVIRVCVLSLLSHQSYEEVTVGVHTYTYSIHWKQFLSVPKMRTLLGWGLILQVLVHGCHPLKIVRQTLLVGPFFYKCRMTPCVQ